MPVSIGGEKTMKAIIPLVMILVLASTASAWAISYFRSGYYSEPILCKINTTVYKMTRYDCYYNMGRMLMEGEKVPKNIEPGWGIRRSY